MADRITHEDIDEIGWNSPEHENPRLNAAITAAQLNQIGHLLVDIRDELTRPPDVIFAEAAPEEKS